MKSIISILCLSLGIMVLAGCSGKYQTNKLPDEKKVFVPEGYETSKYYLYEEPKEAYKKYVIEEFNHGFDERELDDKRTKSTSLKETKNSINRSDLWHKGYELDRKRY